MKSIPGQSPDQARHPVAVGISASLPQYGFLSLSYKPAGEEYNGPDLQK
jgi:hypothetical protein